MSDQAPEPVEPTAPADTPTESLESPESTESPEPAAPIGPAEPTAVFSSPTSDPAIESSHEPTLEPRRSGFHPVTVGHLVMSLIFLCVFVLWVVLQTGGIRLDDLRWAIPFPFLVAGVIGLVAAAITARRQGSR